ncbi:hypothetical protein D9611_006489 [Ephemerocybe angulata]|uniref:Uncharacterized protein n=1 Tax=Ephemerocybe angulata TaxID=980116 RepID=A0A8H5C9D8_9AGAR|nr:hypothetical protein D9611_006489 [Tulosesus angulatus]
MDDLVASLSSSHIGQEAHDLAALQVQLAEAFSLSGAPEGVEAALHDADGSQPGDPRNVGRCRRKSRVSVESIVGFDFDVEPALPRVGGYEDFEDELMVEDLLVPEASMPWSSSVSTSTSTGHHHTIPNTSARMNPSTSIPVSHQPSSMSMSFSPATSPSSAFALNDPFFLQTQANAQSYFHDNSNILQHGHPGASSSFAGF